MCRRIVANLNSITLTIAMIAGLFVVGCGTVAETEDVAAQRSNMRSLAAAYGRYTKENRGRPPKSEKSFRKWIEKQGSDYLDELKVDSIDDIFISSRDNEPYVVVYGKAQRTVAYEAVGVDGSRYVADDLNNVELVDEAKFNQLVPDAK